jgi:phage terminase large subunit
MQPIKLEFRKGFVPNIFLPLFKNYGFEKRDIVKQLILNQKHINATEGNAEKRIPINLDFKESLKKMEEDGEISGDKAIKYFVSEGGAGGGKSKANTILFPYRCLTTDSLTVLVIRENYSDFKESTWAAFLSSLREMGLRNNIDYRLKTSKYEIIFNNGSRIIFKGTDDPEDLKGLEGIDVVWLEEATAIDFNIWQELKTRLRGKAKMMTNGKRRRKFNQFYVTFNPESEEHWLKDEFFTFDENTPHRTLGGIRRDLISVTHSTFMDNHFVDSEEYFEQMRSMEKTDPTQFRVKAYGEWGRFGEAIYENFRIEQFNVRAESSKYRANVWYGLDFGHTEDPTALVGAIVNNNEKKIYIFDSVYFPKIRDEDLASKIKTSHVRNYPVFGDCHSQHRIDELNYQGATNVVPGFKGNKMNRVTKLKEFEIIILPKCREFIKEIDNYQWKRDKKTGKKITDKLPDGNDHLLDALSYAITPMMKPGASTPSIKQNSDYGL